MIGSGIMLPGSGGLAGELAGAVAVGLAFLAIFGIAELWRIRFQPPLEWTRKFVHIASGVVAAFFPWAFHTHWTVLALGLAFALIMRTTRRLGWLTAIHGVERPSKGELYYPIGVYLLFVIGRQHPVFYLISLSALVVSDSVAALLGERYGRILFPSGPGGSEHKSIEGSAVFFVATFLGVHLPLLLFTDVSRASAVLVGLQVALLVTSFEAISQRGNDNLIVPLATYYLLLKMTTKASENIALQLACQLSILLLTLLLARRTGLLTIAGAIAAHLVLYGAFALGGHIWILAPALTLAGCILLDTCYSRTIGRPAGGHQVRAVFWASIVSMLLLFADNTFNTLAGETPLKYGHPFYTLFVGALAAQLAIMAFQNLRLRFRVRRLPTPALAAAAALGSFAGLVPLSLWLGPGGLRGPKLAAAGAMCVLALAAYLGARKLLPRARGDSWGFRLQALSVVASAVAVLPFHLWFWLGTR